MTDTLTTSADQPHLPLEDVARQNDELEKMFARRAIPKYLQYVDDIAREIRDANRGDDAANKKAIVNLVEYMDWLDVFHGTREKQDLIQTLGNNPKFMLFKDHLQEFEQMVAQYELTSLVDSDYPFDRLHANLERFEGYKLVIARTRSSI